MLQDNHALKDRQSQPMAYQPTFFDLQRECKGFAVLSSAEYSGNKFWDGFLQTVLPFSTFHFRGHHSTDVTLPLKFHLS